MAHPNGPVILALGLKRSAGKTNDEIFRSNIPLRAPAGILTFNNGAQDSVKLSCRGAVQRIVKAGAGLLAPCAGVPM